MNTAPDLFGHRAPESTPPPPPPARMAPKPPPKRVAMSEETKAKLAASRPSMTDRDHAICAQATAFSQMSGSRLATALRDQLLILSDIRWSTLSPFQRADLLALTEAMARRIKSAEAEPESTQPEPGVPDGALCAETGTALCLGKAAPDQPPASPPPVAADQMAIDL